MKLNRPRITAYAVCLTCTVLSGSAPTQTTDDWKWRLGASGQHLASSGQAAAGYKRVNGLLRAAVSNVSGETNVLPDYGEGDFNGPHSAYVSGISADGSVVGGNVVRLQNDWPLHFPVQWIDGSMYEIRFDGRQLEGQVTGVADSGLSVGRVGDRGFTCEPYAEPRLLQVPDGYTFRPACISRNGSVIAGNSSFMGDAFSAFWNEGTLSIHPPFSIRACSNTGIAVGTRGESDSSRRAVFTYEGELRQLPHPDGQFWNRTEANGISADGRYIVGLAVVTVYAYGVRYDPVQGVLWEIDNGSVVRSVNMWGSTLDPNEGLPREDFGFDFVSDVVLDSTTRSPVVLGQQQIPGEDMVIIANLSENVVVERDANPKLRLEFETSEGVLPNPNFENPGQQLTSVNWLVADQYNSLIACNTRVRTRVRWRYVGLKRLTDVKTALYIGKAGLFQDDISPLRDFQVAQHLQPELRPGQVIEWRPEFIPENASWRLRDNGIYGYITIGVVLDSDNRVEEWNELDNLNSDALTYRRNGLHLADPTFWYRIPSQAELNDRFGFDENGLPKIYRSYDNERAAGRALREMGFAFLYGWRKRATYASQDYCPYVGKNLSMRYYDVGAGILPSGGRFYIMFQDYSRRIPGFAAREPSVLAFFESPLTTALWAFYVYRFHMLY